MRGVLAGLVAVLAGLVAGVGATLFLLDHGPGERRVPEGWTSGMNLTAFLPDAYAERPARRAMLTARAVGTDLVALVPTWYMAAGTDSAVISDPEKTPTDASIVAAAAEARLLGLEVVIKPHVDVLDGTFRGEIAPGDRGLVRLLR